MITIKKTVNLLLENKALTIILLTAIILRFFRIDYQSLWMDELYTLNVASPKHSFSQIISEVNLRESYPYLYFFIMNALFTLFGDTSIVVRTPSVIFGVLAVWMIYKIGKELYSKNAGLIAATLLTLNQYVIYHSQDGRAYTFYLFGVLLSYYCFIKFIKEDSRKNMYLYAISAGFLLNTNFFSVLNVLSQGFFMLFVLMTLDKNNQKAFFKKILIIIGIVFLFFIPNAYKFYLLTKLKVSWIPQASNEALMDILKEIIGSSVYLIFIFSILFTFFMIKVFSQKQLKNVKDFLSDKLIFSYLIIFSWITFVLLVIIVKSYTGSSIYLSRYFISLLPPFLLATSIAFVQIKNLMVRYSFLLLLLFFLIFDLIVVKRYYSTPLKAQFREASDMVKFYNPNKDKVYTSLKYWYSYFFNKHGQKVEVVDMPNLTVLVKEMQTNPALLKSFWVVDGYQEIVKLSDADQQFLDTHFRLQETYDGLGAIARHYIKK